MGSAAWLRYRPDPSRAVVRRAQGGGRLPVPRASAAHEKGMGHLQVGSDRGQSASEILSDYPRRQETAAARGIAVDRVGDGDWPRHEPGDRPEGLNMALFGWFGWLKRRRLDEDDFEDEIRSHLAMAA